MMRPRPHSRALPNAPPSYHVSRACSGCSKAHAALMENKKIRLFRQDSERLLQPRDLLLATSFALRIRHHLVRARSYFARKCANSDTMPDFRAQALRAHTHTITPTTSCLCWLQSNRTTSRYRPTSEICSLASCSRSYLNSARALPWSGTAASACQGTSVHKYTVAPMLQQLIISRLNSAAHPGGC